ncbi:MAG: PQQ-binding-like beta-propeller repeat protein [Deltaproteobacteria bacterium]|nr:PQQ-binding-like beta-propeller repeat protein [Deltaproteobacteria bacterium]
MPGNFSKRLIKAAAVLFILSGCAAPKAVVHKDWPTYLNGYQRANMTGENLTLPLAIAWDRNVSAFNLFKAYPKEQLSSPVISNGVLYAGSTNEEFYTVDFDSGKTLWKFDSGYPVEATATVEGQSVYFGSSDGVLRCLDRANGKEAWRFTARSEILSSPVVTGGRVYFSSSDDRVYALDAKTGEKAWSYNRGTLQTVTPRIYASPAWSNGRLYVFFSDGTLVSLSADTGKEAWSKKLVKRFDNARQTRRTPLVAGGAVYAIDDNNAVEALSEDTGEVKGIYNIIKAYDFIALDRNRLVIAGESQVAMIDRLTGAVLWKSDVKYSPLTSVFAAGDALFVVSKRTIKPFGWDFLSRTKGRIQALSLKDGGTLWEKGVGSSVTANASAGDAGVALLTDKGLLTVFKTK